MPSPLPSSISTPSNSTSNPARPHAGLFYLPLAPPHSTPNSYFLTPKAIPHNSKYRYGERGAAAAKPKAQIILDAAKVSAASGGNSEPKQGQRSQSARGFCPRSTMRIPQPDIIEHFGNADAVPQPPKRCLSRKAGIVRCCPRFSAKCPCLHGKILIRWESRKKQKNGLFLQRGGLFEFPVSPKWIYNRKESL